MRHSHCATAPIVAFVIAPIARGQCTPAWDPRFSAPGMDRPVSALAVLDRGQGPELFAGGLFRQAGGRLARQVARWIPGNGWEQVGDAFPTEGSPDVRALAWFDDGTGPALCVGGNIPRTVNGVLLNGVARLVNGTWQPIGRGVETNGIPRVLDLEAFPVGTTVRLHVAGGMSGDCGGSPPCPRRWGYWDGVNWVRPLGLGVEGLLIDTLEVFDDGTGSALYLGGTFSNAGGTPVLNVARWDGFSVRSVGTGFSQRVKDFVVYDDGTGSALYAGGTFALAGTIPVNGVARWDGHAWTGVGGGVAPVNGFTGVWAMEVFDDGGGPRLYVAGPFTHAGGAPANNIASWDGSQWRPLGAGIDGYVHVMQTHDDGSGIALYIGGEFSAAGGLPANNIARWQCAAVACYPDCDLSTGIRSLDVFDFLCFQNRYVANDPYACDCDTSTGPGVCDVTDFLCFQNAYAAGCP